MKDSAFKIARARELITKKTMGFPAKLELMILLRIRDLDKIVEQFK